METEIEVIQVEARECQALPATTGGQEEASEDD